MVSVSTFWGLSDGIHAALQIDPDWPQAERSLNSVNEKFRKNMIRYMERELEGIPGLLKKVIPDYPPYGKRMLIDNHWFKMLKRKYVELETGAIERINQNSIIMADGERHETDVIVVATGFHANRMLWPIEIIGRQGIRLRDVWGDDYPKAYLGITMPKLPHLFVLYCPNTNLGHGGSAMFHEECQVRYTIKCLHEMIEFNYRSLEFRKDVHDSFNEHCDAAPAKMVWSHQGVKNWYKNEEGRVFANSHWRLVDYWRMTKSPKFNDFIFN